MFTTGQCLQQGCGVWSPTIRLWEISIIRLRPSAVFVT